MIPCFIVGGERSPNECRIHSQTDFPYSLKDQVKCLEDKFDTLVDNTYQELNGKIEPSHFLVRITRLPVLILPLHKSFIEEKLIKLSPPVTFLKVWLTLNLYWNFLNYELLQHVIEKCVTRVSSDLKQQMLDYIDELLKFKQRTRLCDLCDFIKESTYTPPEGCKKIVVKMQKEWCQCTLQEVEYFKKDLIDKFFLQQYDILFQSAEKGSICITWLTSTSIATLLKENLAKTGIEFFSNHGIDAVTIDGEDVCFTPGVVDVQESK